ncbi:MAG: hypothetical protein WCK49_09890, partial [Myxococcaceae bacterium]
MSSKYVIGFISILLLADLAVAGPKQNQIGGFVPALFAGFRAVAHRLAARMDRTRARTTPEQDAYAMLQAMQRHLEAMQTMNLIGAEAALREMQRENADYFAFLLEY